MVDRQIISELNKLAELIKQYIETEPWDDNPIKADIRLSYQIIGKLTERQNRRYPAFRNFMLCADECNERYNKLFGKIDRKFKRTKNADRYLIDGKNKLMNEKSKMYKCWEKLRLSIHDLEQELLDNL